MNIADRAYSDDESVELRFELVAKIEASADAIDPAILEAMRAVPREVFVPSFFLRDGASHRLLRREIDETNWLAETYRDQALTTQLDCGLHADAVDAARDGWRGVPTCSASEPSLLALMLDELAIQPGARVLEIGAGTGYTAALLCELTEPENVFSIEFDPVLATKAIDRLVVAGYYPTVSIGDGAIGHPNAAPFDAIVATCSFPAIYPAWLEQLAPGGIAVVNLITGIPIGILVVLTLNAPGDAIGRIVPQRAWIMSTRSRPANRALALSEAPMAGEVRTHTTELRWSEVAAADGLHVLTALMLDAHLLVSFTEDGAEQYGLYANDGSVALEQEGRVEQSGPRQLWDELERLARQWTALGQPDRDEFELSIAFKVGKAHTVVVHPASGWSASATGVTAAQEIQTKRH